MANITIKQLKDSIAATLEAMPGTDGKLFQDVYKHPIELVESSPICVIRFARSESDFATNFQNHRVDNFNLDVIIPLQLGETKLPVDKSVEQVEYIIDKLRNEFDSEQDLNGLALYCRAVGVSSVDIVPFNNGLNIIASVILEVETLFSIT